MPNIPLRSLVEGGINAALAGKGDSVVTTGRILDALCEADAEQKVRLRRGQIANLCSCINLLLRLAFESSEMSGVDASQVLRQLREAQGKLPERIINPELLLRCWEARKKRGTVVTMPSQAPR